MFFQFVLEGRLNVFELTARDAFERFIDFI